VVGTINHDRIVTPTGETHEDLGGILYNVLTMAPFLTKGDSLLPIARVGVERRAEVEDLLSPYPAVDLSGLLWWGGGTNETVLRYLSPDFREETLIERIVPFEEEEIRAAAASDVVIVNMIWGRELGPELLRTLGSRRARVLLDIQSLPLTFAKGPGRAYRNIPSWRSWAAPVEVLKGNAEEVRWFVGERGPFEGGIRDAARLILEAGPSVVVVTMGSAGSLLAWKDGARVRQAEIPPVDLPPEAYVDSTGCGDAYFSGYALGILEGEEAPEAALLGSTLAGLVCCSRGLRALRSLPDPFETRRVFYKDLLEKIGRGAVGEDPI
jgi:sugar/nucleoside kinase (ribokinase family)